VVIVSSYRLVAAIYFSGLCSLYQRIAGCSTRRASVERRMDLKVGCFYTASLPQVARHNGHCGVLFVTPCGSVDNAIDFAFMSQGLGFGLGSTSVPEHGICRLRAIRKACSSGPSRILWLLKLSAFSAHDHSACTPALT
jgi:hypothetical protein